MVAGETDSCPAAKPCAWGASGSTAETAEMARREARMVSVGNLNGEKICAKDML